MQNESSDLFSKLGIDIGDNKINIDINQTKEFFNTLKGTFETAIEDIQSDISEGKADMSENIGVKIDSENINIDLNKTRDFIEGFGRNVNDFVAKIDEAVERVKRDR